MGLVKHNNNSISAVTSMASLSTGSMTLIKEQTASSSSTVDFKDGTSDVVLDSTYPIYLFKIINAHPSTDSVSMGIQANASGGSGFNETVTTTAFRSEHYENAAADTLAYHTAQDVAQGTGYAPLNAGDVVGNGNDESMSGDIYLFNPSSTVFMKHFISRVSQYGSQDIISESFVGGYFNLTSAIDEISFKFSSGNIDSGTFQLYGIKGS